MKTIPDGNRKNRDIAAGLLNIKRIVQRVLFLFFLLIAVCSRSFAGTYYVSYSTGSDLNSGLSEVSPLKTIERVNTLSLVPGDKVLFKCGDTWKNQTLIIKDSGTAGNYITFGSYPENCDNKPVISGSAPITGWTHHSGNIYVADLSSPANSAAFSKTDSLQIMGINQLFRNNERLLLGRWPNLGTNDNGYSEIDGYPSSRSITDNELANVNWAGAAVHIKSMRWLIINRIVSSSNGTTLHFSEDTECYGGTCAGWGYFINNHFSTLDQDGEWFYDEDTFKVYLFSTGGMPSDIEGAVIKSQEASYSGCIVLGQSYIEYVIIENFELKNSFANGMAQPGSMRGREHGNVIIRNNLIRDVDSTGLRLITWIWDADEGEDCHRGGYNFEVSKNIIDGANHFGIDTFTRDSRYRDNTVKNIGLLENIGKSGLGCGFSGSACTENGDGIRVRSWNPYYAGVHNEFQYNVIDKTAYNGMDIFASHNIIKNNYFTQNCYTKGDCGAIRTFGNNNIQATTVHDITIKDNIIYKIPGNTDGTIDQYRSLFGMGLYLDHYSRDVLCEGNTVMDTTITGIYYGRSTGIVKDNVVYNCGNNSESYSSSVSAYDGDAGISLLSGNIIYALDEKAWTLGMDKVSRFSMSDHNYIFHPYIDHHITYQRWDRTSFAGWQTMSGMDPNSKTNWFTLNAGDAPVSRIFWNNTKNAKTISLGTGIFYDLDRRMVTGSITLDAYKSRVLIRSDKCMSLTPVYLLLMN